MIRQLPWAKSIALLAVILVLAAMTCYYGNPRMPVLDRDTHGNYSYNPRELISASCLTFLAMYDSFQEINIMAQSSVYHALLL